MIIRKGEKTINANFAWDCGAVCPYSEMLRKLTGEHCPPVEVKTGDEVIIDLTDDMAVIYHPAIQPGIYASVHFTEFPEIETVQEYCRDVGGFRAGDTPYQPGGNFAWYAPKHKGSVFRKGNRLAIMF